VCPEIFTALAHKVVGRKGEYYVGLVILSDDNSNFIDCE